MITKYITLPPNIMSELQNRFCDIHRYSYVPFNIFLGMQAGLEATMQVKSILTSNIQPVISIPEEWTHYEPTKLLITDRHYEMIKKYKDLIESYQPESRVISALLANTVTH